MTESSPDRLDRIEATLEQVSVQMAEQGRLLENQVVINIEQRESMTELRQSMTVQRESITELRQSMTVQRESITSLQESTFQLTQTANVMMDSVTSLG